MKIERDEAPDPDVKHIAGEATGTRAERYTVGTIEVGRREMIEQIESFPPASDHIPNAGKKVVGGDGEVTQICAALVCGRRRRGHGMGGCGLFRFAPRWMDSVAGAWGRGVGLRPTNLVVPGGV